MVKTLQNIFKAIKKAYREDPYRILDIINSLNENQEQSKNWLVKNLPDTATKHLILGGWYGSLANKLGNSRTVDIDPGCKKYGKIMYPDLEFATEDMVTYLKKKVNLFNSVICTSCEHIDQSYINHIFQITENKKWVTLQSNNYFDVDSHINCKNTLDEFINEIPCVDIYFAGELKLEKFSRFMVIGR